ncbi:MAG: hypothetical protein WCP39_06405 [Chlamydiota bacterium]
MNIPVSFNGVLRVVPDSTAFSSKIQRLQQKPPAVLQRLLDSSFQNIDIAEKARSTFSLYCSLHDLPLKECDVPGCHLSKPNIRSFFERFFRDAVKLDENLQYVSYGSGRLLEDFFMLFHLLSKCTKENKVVKTISLYCIDPVYKNPELCIPYQKFFSSLLSFIFPQTKFSMHFYSSSEIFSQKKTCVPDVLVAVDSTLPSDFWKLLETLPEKTQVFCLDCSPLKSSTFLQTPISSEIYLLHGTKKGLVGMPVLGSEKELTVIKPLPSISKAISKSPVSKQSFVRNNRVVLLSGLLFIGGLVIRKML